MYRVFSSQSNSDMDKEIGKKHDGIIIIEMWVTGKKKSHCLICNNLGKVPFMCIYICHYLASVYVRVHLSIF